MGVSAPVWPVWCCGQRTWAGLQVRTRGGDGSRTWKWSGAARVLDAQSISDIKNMSSRQNATASKQSASRPSFPEEESLNSRISLVHSGNAKSILFRRAELSCRFAVQIRDRPGTVSRCPRAHYR